MELVYIACGVVAIIGLGIGHVNRRRAETIRRMLLAVCRGIEAFERVNVDDSVLETLKLFLEESNASEKVQAEVDQFLIEAGIHADPNH